MKELLAKQKNRLRSYLSSDLLPFSALGHIVLPLLWEQCFLAFLALGSIWLLSFDSENSIAVVNMMAVVNKAFVSLCLGLVTGGTVLVAQAVGAGQKETAGRAFVQAMVLTTGISLGVAAVLLVFRQPLVHYLLHGAEQAILAQAVTYFTGFCVSFPFYALYQSFAGVLRGWGRTKPAWTITLVVNCAELVLTALFLLPFGMGVPGITLAMVLSRLIGAVLAAGLFVRHRRDFAIRMSYLRLSPALMGKILFIAAPLAVEQFLFNSGKAFSQKFIAGFGVAHMAANGVTNAIFDLINIPQATLREAGVTVAGMCIGAGRPDLARRYLYRFLRVIRVSIVILAPLTIPLAALLIYCFGISREAAKLTTVCLALIYTFGPLFLAGSFTAPSGLRAGGDSAYVSAVSLCCMWGVRVTLSYLFAQVLGMGVVGINLAMVIEWMFRNQFFRMRLKGMQWHSHKLLAGTQEKG